MPIGTNGLVSETLKDGKWVSISPLKSSFAINGQKLFDYDGESGTLKLNRERGPQGALEGITKLIEQSEGKGVNLDMTIPFEPKPLYLEGIKHVSYLTPEESKVEEKDDYSQPRVNLRDPSQVLRQIPRKRLIQRVKDYLSGNDHY